MTDPEPQPQHHHSLSELISEHHERAVRRHEEEALAEAAERAGFDLGTDIGHPTAQQTPAGYDVETDLGVDNEPPELRP
ncbi:hypothetical protein ACFFHJ_25885 [Planotetraspora thailandica]|nr:hypothetical protein [Planotetraspora thailandica]